MDWRALNRVSSMPVTPELRRQHLEWMKRTLGPSDRAAHAVLAALEAEPEPADELAGAARKLLGLSIDLMKRDGFPPTHAYHDALVALRRALPDSFVPSAATGGLVDAAPDPPPEAELCIDCGSTRTGGNHPDNPRVPDEATVHPYRAERPIAEPPEAVPAEVVAERLAEKFAPGHVLAAKHQIHTAMRDYREAGACPHCGRPLGLIRETPDA